MSIGKVSFLIIVLIFVFTGTYLFLGSGDNDNGRWERTGDSEGPSGTSTNLKSSDRDKWSGEITLKPMNAASFSRSVVSGLECNGVTAGIVIYRSGENTMLINHRNLVTDFDHRQQFDKAVQSIKTNEKLSSVVEFGIKASCTGPDVPPIADIDVNYSNTDYAKAGFSLGSTQSPFNEIDQLPMSFYVYAVKGDHLIKLSGSHLASEIFSNQDQQKCSIIGDYGLKQLDYSCLADIYESNVNYQNQGERIVEELVREFGV